MVTARTAASSPGQWMRGKRGQVQIKNLRVVTSSIFSQSFVVTAKPLTLLPLPRRSFLWILPVAPKRSTTSVPAHSLRCEMLATKCRPDLRWNFMPAPPPHDSCSLIRTVVYNRLLEGWSRSGAQRLGRGDGAGGRDLSLAARPRRWRTARRAAPTAASTVRGSSAARAASTPVTAGLHARTRIGSATRRLAHRRCLCRTSLRKSTWHMKQGTGGGF